MKNLITLLAVITFIGMFVYVQSEEREFKETLKVQMNKAGRTDSTNVAKLKVPTLVQLKATVAK